MVREQKSTIYIICYMFADNRTEADDLVQEVLVNLWKGFHKFEGRSDIRTWVYRVSLNTCISSTRKKTFRGSWHMCRTQCITLQKPSTHEAIRISR